MTDAPLARRAVARVSDFVLGVLVFVGLGSVTWIAAGRPESGTGVMAVSIVNTYLLYHAYEIVAVGVFGQTLGKTLFGLRVVRLGGSDPRDPPGLWRAVLRDLIPAISVIAFFPAYPLVYLLSLFGDHRFPNDRLAGTRVVRSS